jgi:hypothetical protein
MFKYGILIKRLIYICLCTLTSIVFSNCTTTSQMYLQSAKSTDDLTYGFSISNPIMLKYSKSFGNEKIIEEYIGRLCANIKVKSSTSSCTERTSSFTILERETIASHKSDAKQVEKEMINGNSTKRLVSLERYKITSENGEKTYTLYFKLVKNKRKLYIPSGFMYSRLSG